jgi:hypothetical protein
LDVVRPLSNKVRFILGGHENPMIDLENRLMKYVQSTRKIKQGFGFSSTPHTIAISSIYLQFQANHLLALEAGAGAEYLYQLRYLEITNLKEIKRIPKKSQ